MNTSLSIYWQILLSLFFLLISELIFSQDIQWEKSLGGRQAEYLNDIQPTPDYGFIVGGSSFSGRSGNKSENNKGDLDYWIWKMSENGDLDWQKSFGGSGSDMLKSVILTSDGGFILAGNSNSPIGFNKLEESHGSNDFWIIKLDANGNEQWQKTIGGLDNEDLSEICQTGDGGYILGGSSASTISLLEDGNVIPLEKGYKIEMNRGSLDYWVIKLDSSGNIKWQKTFGGIYSDILKSVKPTIDGGFIVGGYSNSPSSFDKLQDNGGIGDFWILKLEKNGEIDWQKTIGGGKDDQLYVLSQTRDGGYIIGGNSNSDISGEKTKSNKNGTDFWVIKLKFDGEISWQQTYDFGNIDILTSIIENEDHTFLIGGYSQMESRSGDSNTSNNSRGLNDYIALKVSETGEHIWDRTVGSDGEDRLSKVIESRDGGYILAGTSNPIRSKVADYFDKPKSKLNGAETTKVDALGNAKSKISDEFKNINDSVSDQITSLGDKVSNSFSGVNNDPSTSKHANPVILNANALDLATNEKDFLSSNNKGTSTPPSKDKTNNYGDNDFWVVKLKDKSKKNIVKAYIEAIPNPTKAFTNIIVGYDFQTGNASLVDISGHILQEFPISNRTVPIDLTSYPVGIYIVNIRTDVKSDGIKIIKTNN